MDWEQNFEAVFDPPTVKVASAGDDTAPVKELDADALKALGYRLTQLFNQYRSDRRLQELRWLRNLRQYLGFYDPEVEKMLSPNRSVAYPKLTRVKCITMQAQIMELMFPSDDKNWTVCARPAPDMDKDDIAKALAEAIKRDEEAGTPPPKPLDLGYVMSAVQTLADERARDLTTLLEDQLQELGGDQSYDYEALNGEVVQSGIQYGLGMLRGPFARPVKSTEWTLTPEGSVSAHTTTVYMPQFEFTSVWEFYPDLSAKRLEDMDGYFLRRVMSRGQVLGLASKGGFFGEIIREYLASHTIGNYRPLEFETELRSMGIKMNVNETKVESTKYEIVSWHGKIDGRQLADVGVEVAADKLSAQVEAEIWMIDGYIIKAVMNPWAELDVDVCMLHAFMFDRDDTSPIGFGLPNILRDTQMAISASTRMMLDNASVVAGPILEMNTNLLRPDQDLTSIQAYKTFYRDDDAPTAQFPAIRNVEIDAHLEDLQSIIKLFMQFADMETFVTPQISGDMTGVPSEPFRNAVGASMLLGKASLPFKQIIRNFDKFTASVIQSLVQFNRAFNPEKAKVADYDVIARGATSLIAKEVRGMQIDQLVTSMTPEEKLHTDTRKLAEARFRARDLEDMLVSEDEAARREAAQNSQQQQVMQQQQAWLEANIRSILSQAFKNITQGNKNAAAEEAQQVASTIKALESGLHEAQQIVAPDLPAPGLPPSSVPGAVPPGPAAPTAGPGGPQPGPVAPTMPVAPPMPALNGGGMV